MTPIEARLSLQKQFSRWIRVCLFAGAIALAGNADPSICGPWIAMQYQTLLYTLLAAAACSVITLRRPRTPVSMSSPVALTPA